MFLPLVSSITQFRVRRTSFSARYFLRNINSADLVVPASSAVCHKKKKDPLIYWRCVPVLPQSPVTAVLLLLFTFLTFTSKFHLMKLLHGCNHHTIGLLHRVTRAVPLHRQACSPSTQTDLQSFRTNRPAVPP